MPTIEKKLLDISPKSVSHVQVYAARPLVRNLVSAQMQHLHLRQTSQIRSVSELSDSLVANVVVAQVQELQVGEIIGAEHAVNDLDAPALH